MFYVAKKPLGYAFFITATGRDVKGDLNQARRFVDYEKAVAFAIELYKAGFKNTCVVSVEEVLDISEVFGAVR